MRVNMHANGHVYGQLSLDDPEKSALYHEPFRPGDYSKTLPSETIRQTDYDEHYQIGENYQLSRLSCIPSTNLTKSPPNIVCWPPRVQETTVTLTIIIVGENRGFT